MILFHQTYGSNKVTCLLRETPAGERTEMLHSIYLLVGGNLARTVATFEARSGHAHLSDLITRGKLFGEDHTDSLERFVHIILQPLR